jgi:hypothetical protein
MRIATTATNTSFGEACWRISSIIFYIPVYEVSNRFDLQNTENRTGEEKRREEKRREGTARTGT